MLSRAVGLDRHFQLDFFDGELQPGDCFLLCSDGVWAALDHARLREQDFVQHQSADSRYRRFMSTLMELPPGKLRYLTEIDYVRHLVGGDHPARRA